MNYFRVIHQLVFALTAFYCCREAQQFVDKFEGALGKGKGRKLYAYKVMMTKVIQKIWSFSLIYFLNSIFITALFKTNYNLQSGKAINQNF